MNKTAGDFLINSLTNDPEKFYNEGKSYELLQEYFKGFSKDTLRILLISKDKWIKRVAIWITSELGVEEYRNVTDMAGCRRSRQEA